jgi:ABC-type multidrug transport system fused ATPase/permease subunit
MNKSADLTNSSAMRKAKPNRRGSFLRLVLYTRAAWLLILALLGCIGVKSLLELAVPWVMGFMLFDGVIRNRDLSGLPLVLGILTAIFLAQKVFSFLQEYLNELTNQQIVHRLRCDLFEHVGRLPLGFFDRRRTGDLQSRITSDVDSADGILKTLVEDFASEIIMLIGTIIFLWAVNWQLRRYLHLLSRSSFSKGLLNVPLVASAIF